MCDHFIFSTNWCSAVGVFGCQEECRPVAGFQGSTILHPHALGPLLWQQRPNQTLFKHDHIHKPLLELKQARRQTEFCFDSPLF